MTCACGRPVEVRSAGQCNRCYKRDWRLDHDSERRVGNPVRARQKEKYDYKPCPKCGAQCNHNSTGCQACYDKERGEGKQARRLIIEALWNGGCPAREIAERLGTSAASIGVEVFRMRADGWDLPRRIRQKRAA